MRIIIKIVILIILIILIIIIKIIKIKTIIKVSCNLQVKQRHVTFIASKSAVSPFLVHDNYTKHLTAVLNY